MIRTILRLTFGVAMLAVAGAFSTSAFLGSSARPWVSSSRTRKSTFSMRVVDIGSETAFDATIKGAGSALVVIDYSTTWCGPCKVIAPKFDELSDKYPDAIFLKVRIS